MKFSFVSVIPKNILTAPDFQRNFAVVLLMRHKHMASSQCTYLRMTVLHREKENYCVFFMGKHYQQDSPLPCCIPLFLSYLTCKCQISSSSIMKSALMIPNNFVDI